MLVTHTELLDLVDRGVISGTAFDRINAASIDVTLGRWVWTEDPRGGDVRLAEKGTPGMIKHDLLRADYLIQPGEFVLAQTHEMFHLPSDIAAEFRLKSSSARAGLDQALAVWCDPGWHGSVLTLELRNNLQHHTLVIQAGMKIGQMVFWRGVPVPDAASYAVRGQYNHHTEAQQSLGIR